MTPPQFISSKRNLQRIMLLLRDKSKNIQFEAFHVFKVRCDVLSVIYPLCIRCMAVG